MTATIQRSVTTFVAQISRGGNTFPVVVERVSQPINVVLSRTNGQNGKSAYEVAVANGFVGTEEQWLQSIGQEYITISTTPPPAPYTNQLWLDIS